MSAWTNPYWPRSGERGIDVEVEQLAADEGPEPGLERLLGLAGETAASAATVKVWPRTERVLEQSSGRPRRARRGGPR